MRQTHQVSSGLRVQECARRTFIGSIPQSSLFEDLWPKPDDPKPLPQSTLYESHIDLYYRVS